MTATTKDNNRHLSSSIRFENVENNTKKNEKKSKSNRRRRHSWIPSVVEIPTTTHEQKSILSNDNKRVVLVVVGVRFESENYWKEDCPAILREDFPHFPQNLKNTIELCRNSSNNTEIIHIHSVPITSHSRSSRSQSQSTSRLSTSSSPSTSTSRLSSSTSAISSSSLLQADRTISRKHSLVVDKENINNSNRHAKNANIANANADVLRPRKGELLIPNPCWSSSGNIHLLDALKQKRRRGHSRPRQRTNFSGGGNYDTANVDTNDTDTTVLVCGLVTSICVLHTAILCSEAGYKTFVIEDACADRGRNRHDQALHHCTTTTTTTRRQQQPVDVAVGNNDNNNTSRNSASRNNASRNNFAVLSSYRDLIRSPSISSSSSSS